MSENTHAIRKAIARTNLIDKRDLIDKIVLNLARQKKQIVYGARSIQAQNPLFARNTTDYDILSKNPQADAHLLRKKLNKLMELKYFYTKPAKHKGTFKVKGIGFDFKKGTEDDEDVADYTGQLTGMSNKVPTFVKNGVRYRLLKLELQRKITVAKDPEYAFRKEKDEDDIRRIKGYLKVKRLMAGMDT